MLVFIVKSSILVLKYPTFFYYLEILFGMDIFILYEE